MSMTAVVTRTVHDRWVGILVACSSIGLLLAFGMAVYADIGTDVYESLPEAIRSVMGVPDGADPAALAYNVMLGTIGSLTLAGLAVSIGASAIAGEERDGTLGLLLANPASRTAVLVAKVGGLVALIGAGGLALWGASEFIPVLLDVEVGAAHPGAMALHVTVNALFYGFLAVGIGGWTGRRGLASGVPAGLIVVSFVLAGLLPLLESTEPFVNLIPWHYLDGSQPLLNGADWGDLGVLLAGIAVFATAALVGLRRRDLRSRSLGTSLLDHLRADPRTQRLADRLAGSTRVSSIAAKTASEHQGLLLIVALTMFALMGLLMGPMYAAMEGSIAELAGQLPEDMLALLGGADMSTPEGFYRSETLGLMAPIAVILIATVVAARAVAGEEHHATLGLLLANPVPRHRVLGEKALVMVAYVVVVGVATFAGIAGGSLLGGLGMDLANIAATAVMLVLLGLTFGGLALLLGAATGEVRLAVYGTAAAAVVTYVIDAFASINPDLADLGVVSPFYHYRSSEPLLNGLPWGHAAVLLVVAAVLVAAAFPLFARRDLRQS